MTIRVPIETAERDLRRLLAELEPGETATLIGSGGKPEALLISLRRDAPVNLTIDASVFAAARTAEIHYSTSREFLRAERTGRLVWTKSAT